MAASYVRWAFASHGCAERGLGELRGAISNAAEAGSPDAGHRRNIHDQSVVSRTHSGQNSVHGVVGAGRIDGQHAIPIFRSGFGHRAALDIPVLVMGQNIQLSSPENILLVACEFAGMLAAARWISDQRWIWAQPGIMDLPASGMGSGSLTHYRGSRTC